MPEIMLTDEQARALDAAGHQRVTIRTPTGEPVCEVDPDDRAALRRWEAKRGRPQLYYTHEQVQAHMAALQVERDRIGDRFDHEYMVRFLTQLRAADPPRVQQDGTPCHS